MKLSSLIATLVLGLGTGLASAAPFSNDELSLELPPGYQGPVFPEATNLTSGDALTFLFRKPHADGTATVIQVTTWTHHAAFPALPTSMLERLGDKYLDQFLAAEERRNTAFTQEPIRHVLLDGVPFSTRRWRGLMHQRWSVGAMYCGLIDAKVLCLHARDLEDVPDSSVPQAAAVIERVHLFHPPARSAEEDVPASP